MPRGAVPRYSCTVAVAEPVRLCQMTAWGANDSFPLTNDPLAVV